MTDVTDDELLEAIDRIARTPDGQMLYLYFQRIAMEVLDLTVDANLSNSALRAHDARRRFAHELMGRMARGMDESGGGRTDNTGRIRSPVVIFRNAGNAARGRVTPRRWLASADPELQQRLTTDPDAA